VADDETQDLDKLFERLKREEKAKGDPEEHPSVETLTAYHTNELSSEENARIQEHLAACRRCAEIVLELDAFLAEPAGGPEVVDFEAAAEWRRLRERMTKEAETVYDQPRRVAWRRWTPALAAGLTLAVVGLYFLSQPDRPFTTLDPIGSVRGGPPAETVPLSHDLVLRTESDRPYEEYRAEFLDPSTGQLVTEISGLKGNRLSEVLVRVPKSLEPGEYEIRLFGIPNEREGPIGTYSVELQDR
jgi:hypothetical protein